ncbi:putative toxin-antitoxin system toxin component, PIN family [Anabaena sp. UHCC 0451]|uniref:putative toxin-antitoxin system toxin component, PIN family n=1 Tax=Anabaena sp. UHCC 0451 TaxID=2055235 RepID=UPI002B1F2FC8|nr:putative toxin-antitoxin system toxin component, PIN family [Anabaena sp. UHCC 0451]MEA5579559.1 putative toxin-antitoxin system toxin component, PIN family [Anabaena sp. UHCC 0451]
MKVVVDVNVWISALLWKGTPRKILQLAQNQQITIFASDDLFLEFETTLNRAKFANKITSLGLTLADIIDATRDIITFCPDTYIDIPELRDAKDNKIIAAALSANAEVLITGDLDLLTLKEFAGILILTPVDFLNAYFPL